LPGVVLGVFLDSPSSSADSDNHYHYFSAQEFSGLTLEQAVEKI